MNTLLQSLPADLVWRLGWTLLHFLWEGIVIAALAGLVLATMRGRSASARYLVACAALAIMLASASTTLSIIPSPPNTRTVMIANDPAPPIRTATVIERSIPTSDSPIPNRTVPETKVNPTPPSIRPVAEQTAKANFIPWRQRITKGCEPYLPWVVAAWLIGSLALSLRLFGGWIQVQRLRHRWVEPVEKRCEAILIELRHQLRISRPVQLLTSQIAHVPMAMGWLRPVILLPITAVTGLSADQLRALLAHELAHIRRHDYLVNVLQSIIEVLLFYHPVVWWLSRRIRMEREHCCDDIAVACCGDSLLYAQTLAAMEELRGAPQLAAAATGGLLSARIRRLFQRTRPHDRIGGSLTTGILTLSMLCAFAAAILSTHTIAEADNKSRINASDPTRADALSQLAKILAARELVASNFRNLHIVASCRLSEYNKQTRQWEPTPVRRETRSWYEFFLQERMRIDLDPEITKWVNGKAPYNEERYTFTYDGSNMKKIGHLYNSSNNTYKSSLSDKSRQSVDSIKSTSWGTGIDFLPGNDSHGIFSNLLEVPKAHWVKIKVDAIEENGRSLIRIWIEEPSLAQDEWVFDPGRGYALVRYSVINPKPTADVPAVISSFEITQWKELAPGVWFPTAWQRDFRETERWVYRTHEVGFYSPEDADAIFAATDIVLDKQSPKPPAGFVSSRHPSSAHSVAPQTAPSGATPAPQPFQAVLPNGVRVELLGISRLPVTAQSWWEPNGSSNVTGPYSELLIPSPKYPQSYPPETVKNLDREFDRRITELKESDRSRHFAVRLEGARSDAQVDVSVLPSTFSTSAGEPRIDARPLQAVYATNTALIPKDDQSSVDPNSTLVTVAVSSGTWQTIASGPATHSTSFSRQTNPPLMGSFHDITAMNEETQVTVVYQLVGDKDTLSEIVSTDRLGKTDKHSMIGRKQFTSRVVAIDNQGNIHDGEVHSSEPMGEMSALTSRFKDLAQRDIKELRLQIRPYYYAQFKNVSIHPGHKTDVRVLVEVSKPDDLSEANTTQPASAQSEKGLLTPRRFTKLGFHPLKDLTTQPASEIPAKSVLQKRTLRGRVIDEKGQAVAGAKVNLLGSTEADSEDVSGADGSFTLAHDASRLAGLTLMAVTDDGKRQGILDFEYDALEVNPQNTLELVAKPSHMVNVQVVNAAGNPVADAAIEVIHEYRPIYGVKTDATGAARLQVAADLKARWVVALKSGVGFDYFENYSVWPPPKNVPPLPEQIRLVLDGSRSVKVQAVDSAGKPVPHVWFVPWTIKKPGKIDAVNLSGSLQRDKISAAKTDASGIAVFDWIPANLAQGVTFLSTQKGFHCPEPPHVKMSGADELLTARLLRDARVSGKVFSRDGSPAPNILIQAEGRGETNHYCRRVFRTDENGAYTANLYSEQSYILAIAENDWTALSHTGLYLKEGDERQDLFFFLDRGTSIRGRVTTGPDHKPAAQETVTLIQMVHNSPSSHHNHGHDRGELVRWTKTDERGEFLHRVASGKYKLQWPNGESEELTILNEGSIVRDFHLEKKETRQLSGRVIDDKTNAPIAGAIIESAPTEKSRSNRWGFRAVTDDQGRFTAECGMETMVVAARDPKGGRGGFGLAAENNNEITIRAMPAATATGRIINSLGDPAPRNEARMQLSITIGDDTAHFGLIADTVLTDQNGIYTFRALPVGAVCEIYIMTYGGSNKAHQLQVDKPGSITIPDQTINGRPPIRGSASQPAARVRASTLELRIVPNDDAIGRDPQLANMQPHVEDLQANGPLAGHERGDEFQWFEIGQALGPLHAETYQGRRYALLCSREPYAMLASKDGRRSWSLTRAYATKDPTGRPAISIEFDDAGAELFAKLTEANVGNSLAFLIDDKIVTTAAIVERLSRSVQISGTFSTKEAELLASSLVAGMLTSTQPAASIQPAQKSVRVVFDPNSNRSSTQQGRTHWTGLFAAKFLNGGLMASAHVRVGDSFPVKKENDQKILFRVKLLEGKDDAVRVEVSHDEHKQELTLNRDHSVKIDIDGQIYSIRYPSQEIASNEPVTWNDAPISITYNPADQKKNPSTRPVATRPARVQAPFKVATQPAAIEETETIPRVYDVQDLLMQFPSSQVDTGSDETNQENRRKNSEIIQDLIREFIEPGTWENGRIGSLQIWNDRLIIRHTRPVHRQLVEVFAELRESKDSPLPFEARFKLAATRPAAESPKINVFDERGNERIVFQATRIRPINDNEFHMTDPSVRLHLPSGGIADFSADEGQITLQPGEDDPFNARSGWFRGNCHVIIDQTTPEWRQANPDRAKPDQQADAVIKIESDDMSFDLDLNRLEFKGKVIGQSGGGRIQGDHLQIVLDGSQPRIQLLNINKGPSEIDDVSTTQPAPASQPATRPAGAQSEKPLLAPRRFTKLGFHPLKEPVPVVPSIQLTTDLFDKPAEPNTQPAATDELDNETILRVYNIQGLVIQSQSLVDLIQDFIEPGTWWNEKSNPDAKLVGSIRIWNDRLVIRHTRSVHRQLVEVFAELRESKHSSLPLEAGFKLAELVEVFRRLRDSKDTQLSAEARFKPAAMQPAWGEAVEGVQVRMRPDKIVWKAGEVPTFKADVRNSGQRTLDVPESGASCHVEVDGKWYAWDLDNSIFKKASASQPADNASYVGQPTRLLPLWPDQSHQNLSVSLLHGWQQFKEAELEKLILRAWGPGFVEFPESREPLVLAPGRHTIRIAYLPIPARADAHNAVRAISNPVEIEILAANSGAPVPQPANRSSATISSAQTQPATTQPETASLRAYVDAELQDYRMAEKKLEKQLQAVLDQKQKFINEKLAASDIDEDTDVAGETLRSIAAEVTRLEQEKLEAKAAYDNLTGIDPSQITITPQMQAMIKNDSQITSLQQSKSDLEQQRQNAIKKDGANHRSVQTLTSRIEVMDKQLIELMEKKEKEVREYQINSAYTVYLNTMQAEMALRDRMLEIEKQQRGLVEGMAEYRKLDDQQKLISTKLKDLRQYMRQLELVIQTRRQNPREIQSDDQLNIPASKPSPQSSSAPRSKQEQQQDSKSSALDSEPTTRLTVMFGMTKGSAATLAATINALYAEAKNGSSPDGSPPPTAVAEPTKNVVYVMGTKSQIERIKTEVIEPFEFYVSPDAVGKDYPVKLAQVEEVAKALQQHFQDRNMQSAGNVDVPPADRAIKIIPSTTRPAAEPQTIPSKFSMYRKREKRLEDELQALLDKKQSLIVNELGSTSDVTTGVNVVGETLRSLAAEVTRLEQEKLKAKTAYDNLIGVDPSQIAITPQMQAMIKNDSQITSLEQGKSALEQQRQMAIQKDGANHRSVQTLTSRIEVMDKQLKELMEKKEKEVREYQINSAHTTFLNAMQAEMTLRERLLEAETRSRDLDQTMAKYRALEKKKQQLTQELNELRVSPLRPIQPGDRLNIRAVDFVKPDVESNLNQTVDEHGNIYLPKIGKIAVQGLSTSALRDTIIRVATEQGIYLPDANPSVFVDFVEANPQENLQNSPPTTQPTNKVMIRFLPLQHADPNEIAASIRNVMKEAQIRVDEKTNSIIVTAGERDAVWIAHLAEQLDKPKSTPPETPEERIVRVVQLKHAKSGSVVDAIAAAYPPPISLENDAESGRTMLRNSVTAQVDGEKAVLLSYHPSKEKDVLALVDRLDTAGPPDQPLPKEPSSRPAR